MHRIALVLFASASLGFIAAGFGAQTPAARILEVQGKATVQQDKEFSRPAEVFGTIYADERLVVPNKSQVTLVFRNDGHIERVVAAGTFRVTPEGCQPRKGVEAMPMSEKNRATVGQISKGRRGIVQGGVVVARAPAPAPHGDAQVEGEGTSPPETPLVDDVGKLRPINDSTILTAKPVFSWPAISKATEYQLSLYRLGNRVWSVTTQKPQVEYDDETALKPGATYSWEVTAMLDGKQAVVCEGTFSAASERQREDADALKELLESPNSAFLALAAIWYSQNGLVEEAINANEKLAKLAPDAVVYYELANLYFQAGREQDAAAAEAKAKSLETNAAK